MEGATAVQSYGLLIAGDEVASESNRTSTLSIRRPERYGRSSPPQAQSTSTGRSRRPLVPSLETLGAHCQRRDAAD